MSMMPRFAYSKRTLGTALLLINFLCLFLDTGCKDDKPEQEGDDDVKGSYRANVSPKEVTLTPDAPSVTLTLTGQCVDLATCPDNPSWRIGTYAGVGSLGTVTFGTDSAGVHQAVITITQWDAVQKLLPKESSLSSIGLVQSFIPDGLPADTKLTGNDFVLLKLVPSEAINPPQQAQPADKPRLSVQHSIDFTLGVNDGPLTQSAQISYTVPANTLTIDGPTDLGIPGSASKFTIVSPQSGLSLPGDGSGVPPLMIQFHPDLNGDLNTHYKASVLVIVNNGKPQPVILTGVRDSF